MTRAGLGALLLAACIDEGDAPVDACRTFARTWCERAIECGNVGVRILAGNTAAITDTAPLFANITVTNATTNTDLVVGGVRWYWL